MICSNCQHENEAPANFCANCGARLERLCPNCGTPADPSANFCSNCGQTLDRPPIVEKQRPRMEPDRAKAKPSSYMPPHLAKKILRTRFEASAERGLTSYVGRQHELDLPRCPPNVCLSGGRVERLLSDSPDT